MIEHKEKGDRLKASEVNEISRRLDILAVPAGGPGVNVTSRPGGGMSFAVTLPPESTMPALTALAKNNGAIALPAFSPAGIDGSYFQDGAGLRRKLPILEVQLPRAADAGLWVVTAEPIEVGHVGLVWVSGVCPVRIYNDEAESPPLVDIEADGNYVIASDSGVGQVIYEEDVTGEVHMALIRLVGAGGGSGTGAETAKACGVGDSVTKSGPQTVDGVACGDGDQVLCSDGLYLVSGSGVWTLLSTPVLVVILEGTLRGETAYFKLNNTPTYKGLGAFFK